MRKIEMHAKTRYSSDFDSVLDIEGILWNAKEFKERGIVFVDKDSILSFPKIDNIYNKLCNEDKSFKDFKVFKRGILYRWRNCNTYYGYACFLYSFGSCNQSPYGIR